MKNLLRRLSISLRRSGGPWLTLSLLFIVLVPSVGLWWFMQAAVQNEQLAMRQRLLEAYGAQLAVLRESFQKDLETEAQTIEKQSGQISGQQLFAELVRAGSADAVAVFGGEGQLVYPRSLAAKPGWPNDSGWTAVESAEATDKGKAASAYAELAAQAASPAARARALQAEARCYFQAGDAQAALAVVDGPLQAEALRGATDPQGRLIVPAVELLALDLLPPGAPERTLLRARLRGRVLDYASVEMPAAQRRFLLGELLKAGRDETLEPMLAAEELAQTYLEKGGGRATTSALRSSPLSGVWQTGSERGTVVLLHRAERLEARLRKRLTPVTLPSNLTVQLIPPGQEPVGAVASLPAGPLLPGWQLAMALKDAGLTDASQQRANSYLWTAAVTVTVVGLLGFLAWGLVRRQMALSQLRNDLVANVSHELKTPLASMRLLVETLLNSPRLDEQITREYLTLIAHENVRLSRLITNFLTFSRIERNRYSLDFQDISAATIADEAAACVRDRFRDPACHFEVECAPELPVLRADRDALVTAVVNLLDNAWKYSGPEKQIQLSVRRDDGKVAFAVRDNGYGISAADRKRIFQRFQQAHPRRNAPGVAGCGLGLSIVQFIVSAHGGTIQLDSEVDRGSTFTLVLPAA